MTDHDEVALQLAAVKESIDRAEQDFGRRPRSVALVAVSKTMLAGGSAPPWRPGTAFLAKTASRKPRGNGQRCALRFRC